MNKFKSMLFGKKRQIIVHAHMFKNAGSTMDWALKNNFGSNFIDHRDDDEMLKGASYLGPYLKKHSSVSALSSHWITFPLPRIFNTKIWPILLFRHPIERIRSVYQFERKQTPATTPGSKKAKELCFKDYVAWQMEPMPGPAIKNYQTRYCSGEYLGDNITEKFNKAIEHVQAVPLLGIVDRYDESMVLFERTLSDAFPGIDLSYVKQNVTQANKASTQERIDSILNELGDVTEVVLEKNKYDLELYSLVEKLFLERQEKVVGFDNALKDFKKRCLSLTSNALEEQSV